MANEITVPLLPCRSIDEIVEFHTMLGFDQTYYQLRPHPCVGPRKTASCSSSACRTSGPSRHRRHGGRPPRPPLSLQMPPRPQLLTDVNAFLRARV